MSSRVCQVMRHFRFHVLCQGEERLEVWTLAFFKSETQNLAKMQPRLFLLMYLSQTFL